MIYLIPCLLQNEISLDKNTIKTQKKMPRHPLASKILSHEDQLFSHAEKNEHRPMWHFYQQAMVQAKATGNQTMLGSEPPARCRNSNHGGKRDIVLKHLTCSKNRNNHMSSLPGYAGVKLLAHAGWVLPTWKGRVRVQSSDVFIIAEK